MQRVFVIGLNATLTDKFCGAVLHRVYPTQILGAQPPHRTYRMSRDFGVWIVPHKSVDHFDTWQEVSIYRQSRYLFLRERVHNQ